MTVEMSSEQVNPPDEQKQSSIIALQVEHKQESQVQQNNFGQNPNRSIEVSKSLQQSVTDHKTTSRQETSTEDDNYMELYVDKQFKDKVEPLSE